MVCGCWSMASLPRRCSSKTNSTMPSRSARACWPTRPRIPLAVAWAVFGGGLALALQGRGEEAAVVAKRGGEVESKVDGLLRHLIVFGEIRALAVAGEFAAAEKRSADLVRISSAGQYLAWGMANILRARSTWPAGNFSVTVPGWSRPSPH